MSDVVIWHNPRCSKSRQTLALLTEHGITPVVVPYLTQPPTQSEIRTALGFLELPPLKIMRANEKKFAELGLTATSTDDELIAAMAENPVLIERPIVFCNHKAAIGRPPEAVLDIL